MRRRSSSTGPKPQLGGAFRKLDGPFSEIGFDRLAVTTSVGGLPCEYTPRAYAYRVSVEKRCECG